MTPMISATAHPWIVRPRPVAQPAMRLFCLPYAGGAPHVFQGWAVDLPADAEVCAVCLPGRGRRFSEPAYSRMEPLVEALAAALPPWLDRPFALFGHSMGALVGFELVRYLRAAGSPQPFHLFVSGAHAPHLDPLYRFNAMPTPELVAQLRRMGGVESSVLDNKEMLDLMLPVLRADFAVVDTYTYMPEPPVSCPISVFGGSGDWLVPVERLDPWRAHTTGPCQVDVIDGDHFFLSSTGRTQVLAALRTRLGHH